MSFDSKPKYEIKPSSGRAFKNNRAREGQKDAHFNGTFVDDQGVEHFLDIWVNATDPDVQERLVNAIKNINIRTKKKDKQPSANTGRPLAPTQGSFPDTGRYDPVPERASKPEPGAGRPRTTMDDIDDTIPFGPQML